MMVRGLEVAALALALARGRSAPGRRIWERSVTPRAGAGAGGVDVVCALAVAAAPRGARAPRLAAGAGVGDALGGRLGVMTGAGASSAGAGAGPLVGGVDSPPVVSSSASALALAPALPPRPNAWRACSRAAAAVAAIPLS